MRSGPGGARVGGEGEGVKGRAERGGGAPQARSLLSLLWARIRGAAGEEAQYLRREGEVAPVRRDPAGELEREGAPGGKRGGGLTYHPRDREAAGAR
jgi:hypothetical protein